MRQAGRSLPEYRQARGDVDILASITNSDLATEITLQPIQRYGVDAAILFSDIMVPLMAIGIDVRIAQGKGPIIDRPFRSKRDLSRLRKLEPETDMPYVLETVGNLAEVLQVPLIGFAGGPFTLASYLIEGGPSRTFEHTLALMRTEPLLWHDLLEKLAEIAVASLQSQVAKGASALQVFDSWIGVLTPDAYRRNVLPATIHLFSNLAELEVPRIYFGVGTGELLSLMALAEPDVMGIDWRVPLYKARERIGRSIALQGNLDPTACLAPFNVVVEEARRVLLQARTSYPGYIFNLGHGVLPSTNPDILKRLVEFVHEETTDLSYKMGTGIGKEGHPGKERHPGDRPTTQSKRS